MAGTERIAIRLSYQLKQRGWQVRTAFPSSPSSGSLREWSQYQGVEGEDGPGSLDTNARRSLQAITALARFIRQRPADVVNFHYGVSYISWKDLLAAHMAGARTVVASVHGNKPLDPAAEAQKIKSTRMAARFCKAIVVVTEWSKRTLADCGVPESKIRVVPCGIPAPEQVPAMAEARNQLGVPLDAFIISSAGRLEEVKGMDDLIVAAGRLPDPNRSLKLLIGGIGPDHDSLAQLAERTLSGRAQFLGHVKDVSLLYSSSDVFVLATRAENCGLVYREAALHGVPVVGTDVGGNKETILDGKTGLIVPPNNPEALAQAIARLRDDHDLRQRMGQQARERAMREFTEQVMAERYEQVFRD
jgi:glycosyltransferase involved in cell wall biosynthesis